MLAHLSDKCLRPVAGIGSFVAASGLFTAGGLVTSGLAIGAITLGCWLVAQWAGTVDRRTHATAALGLWLVVLGSSAAVGLGRSANFGAILRNTGLVHAIVGVAMAGIVTTIYLAFREYGSSTTVSSTDEILETDPEY